MGYLIIITQIKNIRKLATLGLGFRATLGLESSTGGLAAPVSKNQARSLGFTVVELLIVVVVIAILAAITIVSYNGITS